MDRLGLMFLGVTVFLFYMTFYALYGYKTEKEVIRTIKAHLKKLAEELNVRYESLGTKTVRFGRHIVAIEPAPRYNPIVTRIMKKRGLLKEYVYFQTRRMRVPKNLEILFIPKHQKRLLSKYAGLIAQMKKLPIIEGFVTATNDLKTTEKIIMRNKKTFATMASLRRFIRYIYLEGGELESSFIIELPELDALKKLYELHEELVSVFEKEFE